MEIYFPWEHEEHMTSMPDDSAGSDRPRPPPGTVGVAAELAADGPASVDAVAAGLEAIAAATGLTPREIADRLIGE